ncbi:MAG TPA: hypothetical protein VGX23_19340 [Actinocrinis sp.]|nr:hypothetical protein [Actinocrinis sp.]
MRESLDPDRHARAAEACADAVLDAWPDVERDNALCQVLRANTSALAENGGPALWEPDGHPVLFRAGRSLGESGLVRDAVAYWTNLYHTAQDRLGPDHPHTLTTRSNLAYWLSRAGEAASE